MIVFLFKQVYFRKKRGKIYPPKTLLYFIFFSSGMKVNIIKYLVSGVQHKCNKNIGFQTGAINVSVSKMGSKNVKNLNMNY